jgi:predicted nucleotidyltransferase
MHPLIESHRNALRDLARRRGLANLRVFGSMARGDASARSDVDLLVDLPEGVSGLALGGLAADAQDLLGRPVDVVTEDALAPRLRPAILRQALPL